MAFIAMGVVTVMMSSPAMSTTFSLGQYNYGGSPWVYAGMVTWTSPINGIINISGDAWQGSSTDDVWLQYVPQALAGSLNPGNVLQAGTTHLAAGTVQSTDPSCSGKESLGTTPCIPLISVSSLSNLSVNAGDVIAVLIENYNLYHGDSAGVDLAVQLLTDFQQTGPAGDLSHPQPITGSYYGISGSLKPSSNDSVNAFEFYWNGGVLSGDATTFGTFNGPSTSGFQSGLQLDLYSPSASSISSTTVLGSSATYGTFDFGYRAAGNYVFQLTDLNSSDDPPYTIQFNGEIDPPGSTVPEPASLFLLGAGLGGIALAAWRRRT